MSTRLDAQLQFSSAQAITSTAISENVYDLGPLGGSNTLRDIAAGEGLAVLLHCATSLTDADGNPTLTVTVESDSAVGLDSSATVHATIISAKLEAALVAGTVYHAILPPGDYERYLGLRYTVGVATFDGGTVNAWVMPASAIHTWRPYSDNAA